MNAMLFRLSAIAIACQTWLGAQTVTYTNFIRQVQLPSGVQWDMSVAAASPVAGTLSPLAIDPGGARFELWTVKSSPLTSYLLDSKYVGTYVPVASVAISSEDPYTIIPRTRADRPFFVTVNVSGLLSGASDPVASKSVKLLRHVQSYGAGGTGIDIDRTQALLYSQASLTSNGTRTLTYSLTSVPGADLSKLRGEERFSVFSLEDYQAPESQLASKFIQIWPVANGAISGIAEGQFFRLKMPVVTLTVNDLYPSSTTYAQVYKGAPQLGVTGTVVPGSSVVVTDSVPQNRVLVLRDYDTVFNEDGQWTMELLTSTPFGIDRLAYVSFSVNLTLKLNGSFSTLE
jgi:hypothetical protein